MALPSQQLSRDINRELSTSVEKMLPTLYRAAFINSAAAWLFFGDGLDSEFGDRFRSGSAKRSIEGGSKIQTQLELGKNTNAGRLPGPFSKFATAPQDQVRWTESDWTHYAASVVLSDFDRRINRGISALTDRLSMETRNCMSSLVEIALEDLISGASANGLTGIHALISADDTVQGLSGSTHKEWNSNGLASKSATATAKAAAFGGGSFATTGIQNWRIAYNRAKYGMIMPDVILTTEELHESYESVLVPQERYSAIADVGDASFVSLNFKRKPVVSDPFWTSGVTTFVNLDTIFVTCMSGSDFEFQGFRDAVDQEASVNELQFKGQLVCTNRRYNNKVTGQTA